MKRLRYQVAMSLDGFIAGPKGDYDWIVADPSIDFAALYAQFDTAIMGRGTFETMLAHGESGALPGMKVYVASSTLRASDHPAVTIVPSNVEELVSSLKSETGKDIWLFGGGKLFRTLADAKLVDSMELAVIPVMLGEGIPVLPPGERLSGLRLRSTRALPSGIVMLEYELPQPA
jgi:dihydrofolate reductase